MKGSKLFRYSGLAIILTVLVVGPFLRGLFFWTELLAALGAIGLGSLLWVIGRRLGGLPVGAPGGVAGAALLALLLAYLLQFAWAVYPRGNLDWVLRAAAAWLGYLALRQEAGPALRRWLGWLFVLSAAGVGLVGFLEYTGYFVSDPGLSEALSLVGLHTRMFTTFQYPNTAAVYLLAALLAAAGLALEEERPWAMAVSGGVMTFLALAFFFTISRGAVLIVPFGLLFFLIGLDRAKRWPAILLILTALLLMVATMKPIGAHAAARTYLGALRWLGAATAAGTVGGLLLWGLARLRQRARLAVVVATIGVAFVGLVIWRPAGGFLPKQAARLLDMNLNTPNVVLRLIYDRDALRMLQDRPLGRGGTGWERSYRQYQEFDYVGRETHNHYLQTAVEAGVVGLVAFLIALGAGLWAAWRSRRENPLAWSLAAGAGVIAAHSLIDFNLSFGLIWLLLWSLLGAAASPPPAWRLERPATLAAAAAAVATTGLAVPLLIGSAHIDRAEAFTRAGQAEEAASAARQAARFDPWDSRPPAIMGTLPDLERAVRLDPTRPRLHFDLTIAYERAGGYPRALEEAKAAVAYYPMNAVYRNKAASVAGLILVDALHNDDRESARRQAEELVAFGEEFARLKAIADPLQKLWRAPAFQMSPEFRLRYGQALYLTGRTEEAEGHLLEASKVGLLGSEGDIWLYALYERRGDTAALERLQAKPWVRFRDQNPVYAAIRDWQP